MARVAFEKYIKLLVVNVLLINDLDSLILCAGRIIWGQATLQLAEETSKRQTPWPDPPMPCGIIAGTRSLAWGSPVSWLTAPFCMLPGVCCAPPFPPPPPPPHVLSPPSPAFLWQSQS